MFSGSNSTRPIVYVTRDIERALGMEPSGNYFVISNDTPYGREIQDSHPDNVILIPSEDKEGLPGPLFDTFDLLAIPLVGQFIQEHGNNLLVFQNTPRIERLAAEKGWNLLNPSAALSKTVEEKISQVAWLGDDAKFLPPHRITTVKEVTFAGKKFVLQFNHAHTGQGTYVIESEQALALLRAKFPDRECRVTDFVDGPVFTANVVVGDRIVVGNPSYQITGIAPFTDLPFATIGNDWALPQKPQYDAMRTDLIAIAQAVGRRLAAAGWKGLFGIDAIYDEKNRKTYLLEINARQPASTTLESILERAKATNNGAAAEAATTATAIFEMHIAALLGNALPDSPLPKISGAQIVKRKTETEQKMDVATLRAKGLTVIEYENSDHNKELFRIQSDEGIMESHGALNALGRFIRSCLA